MANCFGGAIAALALLATSPAPGETPLRVRGRIVAIDNGSITVREQTGDTIHLSINSNTNYAYVIPSGLDAIKPGSYIGTAVKGPPGHLIAVEIVLVPVSMRAGRVGFYPWDPLPDRSGIDSQGAPLTPTTMTNGTVRASGIKRAGRTLLVDLVGSKTVRIAVTPHAPIVRFMPSDRSALSVGSAVVAWTKPGDEAQLIAVGSAPRSWPAASAYAWSGRSGLALSPGATCPHGVEDHLGHDQPGRHDQDQDHGRDGVPHGIQQYRRIRAAPPVDRGHHGGCGIEHQHAGDQGHHG